jgi:hypothetical protein
MVNSMITGPEGDIFEEGDPFSFVLLSFRALGGISVTLGKGGTDKLEPKI